MSLFDWLSDAIGGSGSNPMGGDSMGSVDPMGNATGGQTALQPPPVAPPAETPPAPPPPMAKPVDTAAGPDPSSSPPVPMPQPRPPGADAGAPSPPPPPVQPPSGGMPGAPPTPPGGAPGAPLDINSAVQSYQNAGGHLAPPPDAAPQGGPISRALGLDPNRARSMVSGIGAGLTAAGNSAGKSPFQALTSGAGASIEGSDKATDKTYDQKIKYLQAAVAAQSAGDRAAYNKNYGAYLAGKLKADTDKAASDSASKKPGAWNKPDSQKFIDAQHALANDPEVKASQKLLEQTAKTAEPADIAKAQAAHAALIKDKEAKYLAGVGLDPQKLNDLVKNPPGTPQNPHVVTSQSDFDTYVKPGQAYRNPRDGKVYIRKGGDAAKGGDSGAPEGGTSAPAAPGPPPNPMGGGGSAPATDDEE